MFFFFETDKLLTCVVWSLQLLCSRKMQPCKNIHAGAWRQRSPQKRKKESTLPVLSQWDRDRNNELLSLSCPSLSPLSISPRCSSIRSLQQSSSLMEECRDSWRSPGLRWQQQASLSACTTWLITRMLWRGYGQRTQTTDVDILNRDYSQIQTILAAEVNIMHHIL